MSDTTQEIIERVNAAGVKHGYEDAAGTVAEPDPEVLDAIKRGLTAEQIIEEMFGSAP